MSHAAFNQLYRSAHEEFFSRLDRLIDEENKQDSLALKESKHRHV